jgi:hypothetical protein
MQERRNERRGEKNGERNCPYCYCIYPKPALLVLLLLL